jgi:hypothetical protein
MMFAYWPLFMSPWLFILLWVIYQVYRALFSIDSDE